VSSPFACCAWPQAARAEAESSRMAQVAAAAAAMRGHHVVAGKALSGYRKRVLANKRRPLDGMLRKLGRLIVQSAPIRKATSVLTCTRGFDQLIFFLYARGP
jgi:hypothetical protein